MRTTFCSPNTNNGFEHQRHSDHLSELVGELDSVVRARGVESGVEVSLSRCIMREAALCQRLIFCIDEKREERTESGHICITSTKQEHVHADLTPRTINSESLVEVGSWLEE
jgi:hypothetical protein